MSFRVNYGNGQVSGTRDTYREAREEYTAQVRYDRDHDQVSTAMHIEQYCGNGEWIGLAKASRPPVE